ncbi:hypothetical protein GCM10010103_79260 [Streptomyces paradoxus]|uniref:Lipoprotein n=1 Tax=Streptomyces paradoxus TaxID=66375 RepID=A0A7W9TLS0_9ACTN|nr:hypothetical protein [Streptomyces paradoxus]MBB6081692.1 hypothetical protein [Streptomyces paradoxus]
MFAKRGGATGVILSLAVTLTSCTAGSGSSEARDMQEALQPVRDAQSYRMVGEFRSPDGTSTAFDAHVDAVKGGCKGTVGGAESLFFERRVWTRWKNSALDEAVQMLDDGQAATIDPVAPAEDEPAWAAAKLLRGAYMVTDLPAENPQMEGIAPVCKTGGLLAGAGGGGGDVLSESVTVRRGERLRPLTLTEGPVMIRVYVPEEGEPTVRLAEYRVDGGWSFSVRFSEFGEPVTVTPPTEQQTVSSDDVMAVLRRDPS